MQSNILPQSFERHLSNMSIWTIIPWMVMPWDLAYSTYNPIHWNSHYLKSTAYKLFINWKSDLKKYILTASKTQLTLIEISLHLMMSPIFIKSPPTKRVSWSLDISNKISSSDIDLRLYWTPKKLVQVARWNKVWIDSIVMSCK